MQPKDYMDGKEQYKNVRLDELLNEEQLSHVTALLNSEGTDFEKCNAIRRYLKGFEKELLELGVVTDFLAYVIVYKIYGGQNGHTSIPTW